ncbi:MAG: rRNA maturation RNase YbeY [Candidatus Omnitrophica bacterium]|nr:rRNA maturation RNase YbeY [Candidatus Omnitrophota bacterium]MBU4303885.1 rRNA maturation RNase YbeY [Candidatus Omnitrophota bacterium]MBU4467619.1 rRNA maturation RNase YbeY [Candidatus Omnitrophota bacterium]MCG2707321.1 rRNA maturation RNase YbeY [Candidatus Omnitrophota bacterium]
MKITLQNLQKKVPVQTGKIKKLILKVLKGEKVKESGWINLCFVDNPQIKKFNAKFLKTNGSTDVLAFNLSDKKEKNIILADIMISAQAALEQARSFKTTPDYELSLYVVHGILHILGFGDRTESQIKLMRKKESQYVD